MFSQSLTDNLLWGFLSGYALAAMRLITSAISLACVEYGISPETRTMRKRERDKYSSYRLISDS
jgi:hypothetical protein